MICACVVLSTLAYGTVHQPTLALFYAAISAMVILWALAGFSSGIFLYSRHPLQLPLFAAALYALIQMIPFGSISNVAGLADIPRMISAAPFASEVAAFHFVSLGLFFSLLLVYIDSAGRLQQIVALITIFGFIYSFYAIIQSMLSPTRIYGIFERPTPFGSFVNRHNYAAFIEMALAIPLGMLFAGAVPRDKKLLYITAIAIMGSSLLLSGSRGGFVAVLAELILLVILTTRLHGIKAVALKAALTIALAGAVVAGAIFVGGETSFSRFADTVGSKDVTTNRLHIWQVTLRVIGANMPFGAGFGAFGSAFTPYDDFTGLERVEQAHNDYLQVLADAGLVGAAIGGFFLFMLIRQCRRSIVVRNTFRRGLAVGSSVGIAAVLVHSLFDFVLHTTAISVLFLTLTALLVASGRKYPDDVPELEDRRRNRHRPGSSVASFARKT